MDDTTDALRHVKSYVNIAGSAVMQDGTSASLTAPNGLAQQELIQAALSDAQLSPSDVSIIEAHGTGTKLGDPVETSALAAVFGGDGSRQIPLYVTGVKACVGHLEAAAGMAGLFSAILSVQQGEVPPNGQLKSINPTVAKSIDGTGIKILDCATRVQSAGMTVAGISSFGYSGTIVHVIAKQPSADQVRSFSSTVNDAIRGFREGQRLFPKKKHAIPVAAEQKIASANAARTFDDVLKVVEQVVQSLIGTDYLPDYSVDAPLLEIGVDSMGASEIVVQLEKRLGLKDLPGTLIFLCPTVSEMAKYIYDTCMPKDTLSVTPAPVPAPSMPSGHAAIIGVSVNFGDEINSLEKLWDMLIHKKTNCSKTQWDVKTALQSLGLQQNQSVADRLKLAHYANISNAWNHTEFGITANEAKTMPKIQKVLLSVVKKALLDAGYDFTSPTTKNIGIFVGACGFHGSFPQTSRKGESAGFTATTATSNSLSVSAGRISYTFGFTGPCMTIDTACSSALVALHSARRSLQLKECDAAVVCSANILDLESSIAVAVAGMTSKTGRCHTFDETADGYSRGEGAGALVLKRADEVVSEGIDSYCTLVGSAVMQDGRSASLTAPNVNSQENVIRQCLKDSGLAQDDISFVESHGTGTKLGDPVETSALAAVFGGDGGGSIDTPLYVTGVKACVGHLEAAAGMAGLFSAILSVQQGEVPPNGQLNKLNAEVQKSVRGTNIAFPTCVKALNRNSDDSLLAGGVSSFGFSGTIAHVILQEVPAVRRRKLELLIAPSPITVSTSTDSECFQDIPEFDEETQLGPNVVWQFTGQGKLSVNCGRDIHDTEAAFRNAIMRCDQILSQHLKYSATDLLYPDLGSKGLPSEKAQQLLDETQYLQPVLVALEYCLASVWLGQGIRPWAVIGHSIGEYAASVMAGVMSLEDCLTLVCTRGRLTQEQRGCQGCMYALRASSKLVSDAITQTGTAHTVSIAAVNGAQSVVISGAEAGVNQTLLKFPSGTGKMKLGVSHGFHSPVMQCIIPQYSIALKKITLNRPKVRFISTVRGGEVSKELLNHQYWLDHVLHCVRYQEAVDKAWLLGGRTFVEVGPSSTLTKLSKGILTAKGVNKDEYTLLSSIE